MHSKSTPARPTLLTIALWILQALLALLFLFAGGMKLVLPANVLAEQVPLPDLFVRFIGVVEVLGAVGLLVPALLRIRPSLTTLAAAALAVEMVVATVFSVALFGVAAAVVPVVVGLLSAVVAYGRWQLAPHPGAAPNSMLQPVS
jgi:hypothetical protein